MIHAQTIREDQLDDMDALGAAPPVYGADLAAIQAVAFGDHARGAAPALLDLLAAHPGGRVVDLGCGAGDWLRALTAAGHDAVGVEASPHLAARARRRAPAAAVQETGLDHADLSGAVAVTALGEVFNYLTPGARTPSLTSRLRRIARALPEGGLLMFDLIVAGTPSMAYRTWSEGDDWLLAVELSEAPGRGRAERRIRIFRREQGGAGWRATEERHALRIPTRDAVVAALHAAGFRVRVRRSWGAHPLLPRRLAFIARRRDRRGDRHEPPRPAAPGRRR